MTFEYPTILTNEAREEVSAPDPFMELEHASNKFELPSSLVLDDTSDDWLSLAFQDATGKFDFIPSSQPDLTSRGSTMQAQQFITQQPLWKSNATPPNDDKKW